MTVAALTRAPLLMAFSTMVLFTAATSSSEASADAIERGRLNQDVNRPEVPGGGSGSRDRVSLLVEGAKEAFENIRVMAGNDAWSDLTPESRATIDATIRGITDVVEEAIRQDRNHAQELISKAVADLVDKTDTLTKLKKAADAQDMMANACREEEQNTLNVTVPALDTVVQLRDAKLAKCQERDEAQLLKWVAPESGECDFENEAQCSSIIQVEAYLKEVTKNIGDHYANYQEKRAACEAAVDALDGNLAGRTAEQVKDGSGKFMTKKEECDAKQREASTAMCSFGDRLQEKCASISTYDGLVADFTSGRGPMLSEATRREKWEAVQAIKCWLESYRKGKIMEVEVESCKAKGDHTSNVGLIDDQRAKVAPLIKGKGVYNCDETSISFSGFRWKTGGRPAEYVKEPYVAAVTVSPLGQYPFSFCNPA